MSGYLANKPPLFVKVHPMQKGFIVDEDLVGLGDDPDLKTDLISMADISGVSNKLLLVPLSYHLRSWAGEGIGRVSS